MPGQRRVAIVGASPTSRDLANELPEDVEIWGLNQLYRVGFLKRADRWFEMHSRAVFDTPIESRRPAGYIQWLAGFDGPVYMWEPQLDIPNSVRYPMQAVAESTGLVYFTSTIAYMLGLAIYEQVNKIYLFGVDMAVKSEYADQRPCAEYLLGVAHGRDISLRLPDNCSLLKGPVYARGDLNPGGERITDAQLAQRLEHLAQRKLELQLMLAQIEGCLMETTYWANTTPEGAQPETVAGVLAHPGWQPSLSAAGVR